MGIDEIEEEVERCYQHLSHRYYESCAGTVEKISENTDIERYIEKIDRNIEEYINTDNFLQAFTLIQKNLQFVNFLQVSKTKIVARLEKWVQKLFQSLEQLRQKLNAKGFSVSFSIPLGVSIQLSF